jgi:glycosyltransferase involved in cell wall biosynthesis
VHLPFVSVIIPIRNEETFIARTLDSILNQDYRRDRFEIVVVDGMSDDATRRIVGEYAQRFPQIRLVDNPNRLTPDGLNAGIAASRGEIIARIDGHCEVAPDFIRQNVALLEEHPEAWAVGGPMIHAGTGALGQAIATAMSHPLGVGMASHRFPHFEGYADTIQFPTFRRWTFDRVGLFDTALVRTEDDELNFRITQAGGRLFVSPRVRYVYFVRNRIDQLFRQYFQYAFWRIPVMRKHGKPTTVRQVIPFLFFAVVAAFAIAGVWLRQPVVALALPVAYAAAMVYMCASTLRQGALVAALVPLTAVTMHVAYASGLGVGFIAALCGARVWEPNGQMSALTR